MKNKKKDEGLGCLIFVVVFIFFIISSFFRYDNIDLDNNYTYKNKYDSSVFKLISSSENEVFDSEIKKFAKDNNIDINIEYADTLDIIDKLNQGVLYDSVWVSNSIWLYRIDSSKVNVINSKSTSITPITFAIKKSKAEELGFIGKDVYMRDILDAIKSGKLKFSMSNPTKTDSGASAYLGILATLAGNPEVLTSEMLDDENLKVELKSFFEGIERTSGDDDFLEEMFINGDYDAVISYESSIININKKLENKNKEVLYAIYPVDGVSISDSPLAYIDNKDDTKKDFFNKLQEYILSNKGQKILEKYARRTWYGGTTTKADKSIFNPKWGIDTTKYISPSKYPSTSVIKKALALYQEELRRPMHIVFCLDYSGSMYGDGYNELVKAMDYILDAEKAKRDLVQFSSKDKIDVIAFESKVHSPWSSSDGTDTEEILNKIRITEPYGGTALYDAAVSALELLDKEDQNKYGTAIILMTDGRGNVGNYRDVEKVFKKIKKDIPIYSITFGDADELQLNELAKLTNGKVFDGKENLILAFKEVRGYN